MRRLLIIATILVGGCVTNYTDEEWGAKFSGKEFGHVFYNNKDAETGFEKVHLPINSPSVISDFGAKYGVKGGSRSSTHEGIDFHGPVGAPVLAAADGIVLKKGFEKGLGRFVFMDHGTAKSGESLYGFYIHLSESLVEDNQKVERGDQIGMIGTTGFYGGVSHLHLGFFTKRKFTRGSNTWGYNLYVQPNSIIGPHAFWSGGSHRPECFDPAKTYPTDHTVLTIPVVCRQ